MSVHSDKSLLAVETRHLAVSHDAIVASASPAALAIGAHGATNPVLQVDASTTSVATGVKITGAAATTGASIAAISSGTNEKLKIDAKGSGAIALGSTSTGGVMVTQGGINVIAGGATVTAGGLTVTAGGLTVSANGAGITGASTVTGTLGATGVVTAASATAATAGGARALTLGSGTVGVFWGSGVPSATAGQGSLYLRTDGSSTSTRLYVNSDGAGTWVAVTTAS